MAGDRRRGAPAGVVHGPGVAGRWVGGTGPADLGRERAPGTGANRLAGAEHVAVDQLACAGTRGLRDLASDRVVLAAYRKPGGIARDTDRDRQRRDGGRIV